MCHNYAPPVNQFLETERKEARKTHATVKFPREGGGVALLVGITCLTHVAVLHGGLPDAWQYSVSAACCSLALAFFLC